MTVPEQPSASPADDAGTTQDAAALVMYCRSWCPDCRRAKAWLTDNGIPFVEIDVESDTEGRAHAESLNEGRLHTPTFVLAEEVCVDFRPDRLKEMLDMM